MSFIKPMKAKKDNHVGVPLGGYVYEIKYDGVRVIMCWDRRDGMTIYSKSGADITRKFPELIDSITLDCVMTCDKATFDAELVCLKHGIPSFSAITSRFHLGDASGWNRGVIENPVTACLFDVLWFEGKSTMLNRLLERKRTLNSALVNEAPYLITVVHKDGEKLYSRERGRGAEGIIAKRLDSLYLPGRRTKDWLKVKIMYEETVQIYGFTTGKGKRLGQFGSLMFRELDDGTGGSVGTGFTDHELKEMTSILQSRGPKEVKPGVFMLTEPFLAKVKGMRKNKSGAIREPVYIETVGD